jgi:hypothetical protein
MGGDFVRVLARDWPRFRWLQLPCEMHDGKCRTHGKRREAAKSGSCFVGRSAPALAEALRLADAGGPKELDALAGCLQTEIDAAVFSEVAACRSRSGSMSSRAARALEAAARRAVPAEEVISRVCDLGELRAVQAWAGRMKDGRGHARGDLADLAQLREVTLWGDIMGPGELAAWVDRHWLVYWDWSQPSGHPSGGRLFQDAVMLSRDLGFARGASPDLVAEVERQAEEDVAFRERAGRERSNRWPDRRRRWLSAAEAPPHGRHARISDELAPMIAADLAAFAEEPVEAEPDSEEDDSIQPG